MSENQPAPHEKSQAEGDRETVEEAIDENADLANGSTAEQEIAET